MSEDNPKRPAFNVGDIVTYTPASRRTLHCGSGIYPSAVVVRIEPLVLVSHEGDMRWEATVEPDKLMCVGRASPDGLEICMRRLVD